MLTEIEKTVAKHIQGDLSLEKRPFNHIGKAIGLSEQDVIDAINTLNRRGIVRKFGAILRHQKAGLTKNVMVLWSVPDDKIEFAGKILSSYKEITHCYERIPPFEGKYNIFAMMHFKGEISGRLIDEIASRIGIEDYQLLETEEELKKSSMEYFT
jgi:DNA-binding Lrp family transcriptional regulator